MNAMDEFTRLQAKIESGDLPEDEPLFVLRAQDRLAANLVRSWAAYAKELGTPPGKLEEAERLADAMDLWPVKQVPGRPETRMSS